jgi:hypothetical protein
MNVSATADTTTGAPWVGRSIPRVEDPPLLSGRGRFVDDIGVRPGTLHAAIFARRMLMPTSFPSTWRRQSKRAALSPC